MTKDKTLTPPEVVQALLDEKVLSYTCLGTLIHLRYRDGSLSHRVPSVTEEWADKSTFNMETLLNGHTANWSIVHERCDFQGAVRRLRDGKAALVRRAAWPQDTSVELSLGGATPRLISVGGANHCEEYLATLGDFEATDWEDA